MRLPILAAISALVGMAAGFWFGYGIRLPGGITHGLHVGHACECVDKHPASYGDLLAAADETQILLEDRTAEFIARNGLQRGDFDAVFIPGRNGSYTYRLWCSNRSLKVEGKTDDYQKLIESSFGPYRAALRRAHQAFWLQEAAVQQPGAGQPAPRPVDEPEGGDKPQPEAEGRSR